MMPLTMECFTQRTTLDLSYKVVIYEVVYAPLLGHSLWTAWPLFTSCDGLSLGRVWLMDLRVPSAQQGPGSEQVLRVNAKQMMK